MIKFLAWLYLISVAWAIPLIFKLPVLNRVTIAAKDIIKKS